MLVQKPEWVAHSGPVYSIDVHPGGTRFATAGSDHKVKVWSLLPLLDARLDGDIDCARLLATLSDHHAPVNAVRFSHDGRLLASGSDDKLICLYELREGTGSAAFGSADAPSVENWRPIAALRGHSNNITDLAWSPDDSMLASASLDNTVFVWDAASGHRLKTLAGHESYVKGVAWDPVGSFLATQADDRSVRLWRCADWSPVARATEPFAAGYISTTFSLRLDWAPDGQTLLAVNALKPPCHTAPLLERGGCKSTFALVGHTGAVVAARFNPRLLHPRPRNGQAALTGPQTVTCMALGSQDSKVTVWLSDSQRPLVIASRVFAQSVVDLAWTPDGYMLLACSTDGTVGALHFEPGELGTALAQEAVDAHMRELYGDARKRTVLFAESAAQLQLELVCSCGAERLWDATLHGRVAMLCGGPNFAAAAMQIGTVEVYTMAGRLLLPSLHLGACAAFMATDGAWRLLVAGTDGSLRLWDLQKLSLVVEASVLPLLSKPGRQLEVVAMRLSSSGAPLAVLSDCSAYTLHLGLRSWLRVTDEVHAASAFASALPGPPSGDLARLHAQASAEYRRWLLTYVRYLADAAEEGRLREVCFELLGPARFAAKSHAAGQNRANQRLVSEVGDTLAGMEQHGLGDAL
ncbi:hypothetical protein WJX81_003301 [Elliptochloris bilobata]|uniref:Protein HIRA n=1 Tax=Elliptochloris bilobata TaxID=381761 RepID=A0AAW1S849_9CHLO